MIFSQALNSFLVIWATEIFSYLNSTFTQLSIETKVTSIGHMFTEIRIFEFSVRSLFTTQLIHGGRYIHPRTLKFTDKFRKHIVKCIFFFKTKTFKYLVERFFSLFRSEFMEK